MMHLSFSSPLYVDNLFLRFRSICLRLFQTLSMFFKFDKAGLIIGEIEVLRGLIEQCEHKVNYALLFTEYSNYNFLKNNFEEVSNVVFVHKHSNDFEILCILISKMILFAVV